MSQRDEDKGSPMTRSRLIVATIVMLGGAVSWLARITAKPFHATAEIHNTKVGFQAGDLAPDFTLRSPDGRSVKLSNLRGHPVLLNFWATWCAPCRVEMPWLVELDEKYRNQGLQIVGVSMDDAGAVPEVISFAKDKGVKYQVLVGNSATADTYGGVRFMPQSFFIDSDGKITKAITGLTGKKDLEDSARSLLASDSQPAEGTRP